MRTLDGREMPTETQLRYGPRMGQVGRSSRHWFRGGDKPDWRYFRRLHRGWSLRVSETKGSPIELPRLPWHQLFAGVIVAFSLLQLLNVRRRQLRPVNRKRQFVELAGEGERNLIVLVVHRSASVGADIKVLVPLQDQRQGVLHRLRGHRLAVDLQDARTALADAAHVVEGERTHAEAVVLEVELQRVLAGRQHFRSLPLHAFKIDQVPREHWFALQHVEAVAAEAAALGDDHAFSAALRNLDLGLEVVRRIEDAGCVTVRCARDLTGVGKHGAAGAEAGPRRNEAGRYRRVQWQHLVLLRLLPEAVSYTHL